LNSPAGQSDRYPLFVSAEPKEFVITIVVAVTDEIRNVPRLTAAYPLFVGVTGLVTLTYPPALNPSGRGSCATAYVQVDAEPVTAPPATVLFFIFPKKYDRRN